MIGSERARETLGEAFSDGANRLLAADEPIAGLQRSCGGTIPGVIAMPELLSLVVKARRYGLRLSRKFQANDGTRRVTAWVELEPDAGREGEGCVIRVLTWHAEAAADDEETRALHRHREIDRALAELTARLDPAQNIIACDGNGADLNAVIRELNDGLGRPWTEFVRFDGHLPSRPLHWRLLDGATCRLTGSTRQWRVQLEPLGSGEAGNGGFNLYLTPLSPLADNDGEGEAVPPAASLGNDLVPVLRVPIARIIDNAQTISRKLAGPLAEEYSSYAADIAVAGRHLLSLIDDLADLEAVEAADFMPASERIDLGDIARRAVQVLGAEARAKRFTVVPPAEGEHQYVLGDDRRTLQIVLNLLGNALKYAPEDSQVWLRLDRASGLGSLTVMDQGHGLSMEQQQRMFDKFERLGKADGEGSGLGLYIARRIAEAMRGLLTVDSAPGQGARFTLSLPAAD
jgi:hypothetical protein